jgi:hypothetical protein
VDPRRATVGCGIEGHRESFSRLVTELNAVQTDEFDMAEDIMSDQNAAERRLLLFDLALHFPVDLAEVDSHDPELHRDSVILPHEQAVPRVALPVVTFGKRSHVDKATVERFGRHGHVVIVGEQDLECRRHGIRSNRLELPDITRRRKEGGGKTVDVGRERVHQEAADGVSSTTAGSASSGRWRIVSIK